MVTSYSWGRVLGGIAFLCAAGALGGPAVRLTGDVCPVRIELTEDAYQSAANVKVRIVSDVQRVYMIKDPGWGLEAEHAVIGDRAAAAMCEMALVAPGSISDVVEVESTEFEDVGMSWKAAGTPSGERSFVVSEGEYRLHLRFLLENPRKVKDRPVSVWTARSRVFTLRESTDWTRFSTSTGERGHDSLHSR